MQRQYWYRAHKRAVEDAKQLLGFEKRERVVIAVLVFAIAITGIWLLGGHETAGHEFIVQIGLTAALLFVFSFVYLWKLTAAPAKLDNEAKETLNSLERALEQTRQQLSANRALLSIGDPYFVQGFEHVGIWKIRIHNGGPSAAHVQVSLRDIVPPPRSRWPADYPYPLVQSGFTLDTNECQINRNDDAIFELMRVWRGSGGRGFIMALDTRMPGNNPIVIEQDERWEMKYEVTAENSDVIRFSLQMQANTENIILTRDSAKP